MSSKKPEDAIKDLENVEVTELDDKDLDAVAGGMMAESECLNGNCNGCPAGSLDPNGCSNANCSS